MITIGREQLKTEYHELIALIQSKHVMEDNIENELFQNKKFKPQKGLCHTRGYFIMMDKFFIQYEMDHIIVEPKKRLIGRSLRKVIFYENFQEYESARQKAFNAVKPDEQTGINFN